MIRDRSTTSWSSIVAATLSAICATPATAQADAFSGQWTAGWFPGIADQNYARSCSAIQSTQSKLDVGSQGNGNYDGSLIQYTEVQVLQHLDSGSTSPDDLLGPCGLRNATHPFVTGQIKGWSFRGRLADDMWLDMSTMTANCRSDWCESTDPRFELTAGASNFDTRLYLVDGVLFDSFGTTQSDDDIPYIPAGEYNRRAQEGAEAALEFAKSLVARDRMRWSGLLADDRLVASVADFANLRSEFFSHIDAITVLTPFLATRGEKRTDSWAIRLMLRLDDGASRQVVVRLSRNPSGVPRVTGFSLM